MTCRKGSLDPEVPGSHRSAPPLLEELGGFGPPGESPRGSPRRRHISALAQGLRGRLSGAPEAAGGLRTTVPSWLAAAARLAAAPRLLPARSPGSPAPGQPPFPSPPGRPCPGRALAARLHPRLVRPAGQPFLARPVESQRWPHPPVPASDLGWHQPPPPHTLLAHPHSSDAHFTDGN